MKNTGKRPGEFSGTVSMLASDTCSWLTEVQLSVWPSGGCHEHAEMLFCSSWKKRVIIEVTILPGSLDQYWLVRFGLWEEATLE